MLYSHSFVQSIARINDSATFETSFEVKCIPSTPHFKKSVLPNECDRDNLQRFVKEFEKLQADNSSAKSTPKKFKVVCGDFVNIGNVNSRSLGQSPLCCKDNLEKYVTPLSSPTTIPSCYPVLEHIDMGCNLLASCNNGEETACDESIQLTHDVDSGSKESFEMHTPLLLSLNVTPPTKKRQPQQQRSPAYELASFLRGSFHVKRARITHLRRSLSDDENLQNSDLLPAQLRTSKRYEMKTGKAHKKNILEDTTNQKSRGSTSSICTRLFPGNASPFCRVREQSSLRTSRTNKYALKHCPDMISSESNLVNNISSDLKQCTNTKSSNANKINPGRTQSEKSLTSQSSDVKSWANSFEHLLQEPAALATFAEFLKLEFSAENIYFWTSCERYRNTEDLSDRQAQAKQIFQTYLANGCRQPVNLDSRSRNLSEELLKNAECNLFLSAQKQIFHLMKFDSYQRFIRSDLYKSCVQAEEKEQPLPYGAENVDALLKTNFLQNASPKLKKSASNAEDRRRKIVLPWHRKTRSKSRDRVDLLSIENCNANNNISDDSSNVLNTFLPPSSKQNAPSSTLPPQAKSLAQDSDSKIQQSSRASLPTSLKAAETGCSLCRVKFCDGATTIVQIKPNETIQQLVERVLEKRALYYKHYEVVIKSRAKAINLQASTQELAGEEVEIEQRVTFKIYLPDPKVISVKSKPNKYIHEVVRPILQKYNYDLKTVDVLRRDTHEKIDLSQLITMAEGLRLQIVMPKNSDSRNLVDYQNDNISLKWLKSRKCQSEIVERNGNGNSCRSNFRSSQNNLDAITNSIFNDIIQDKAKSENKLQPTDHYSIKSEECGSEIYSIFDATNIKKNTHVFSMIRQKNKNCTSNHQHSIETNASSNSSQTSIEFNRPIIAKLKAGVKLQVTERVAEKQDELLLSLKTRLDNQTSVETQDNLRRVRANLNPVNKTTPINERPLSLESPQSLLTHSLNNKMQLNRSFNETTNQSASNATADAAIKGPPPLPPKPKVLPTKPSNWGFNISDQKTLQ